MEHKLKSNIICVGDYVALHHGKLEDAGWLCSEGLLSDDCFLNKNIDDFDNCLWEVHVQNQYSAWREYTDAFIAFKNNEDSYADDDLDAPGKMISGQSLVEKRLSLDQLRKAAINEQRLNEKLMTIKYGKPVAFGDPIQLRHVKSQKFLTVSTNILAKQERENMHVSVAAGGYSLNCVGFVPRHKYDKEGQPISDSAEVQIRVHERPGEFIHAAKKIAGEHQWWEEDFEQEINCSLESSQWTVNVFQKALDIQSNTIIAGQLVTLQDPDNLSCLTLEKNSDYDHQTSSTASTAAATIGGGGAKGRVMRAVMAPQFQLIGGFASETGVGTNLLWKIEHSDIVTGGAVCLQSDPVTLRDLNSRLYLKIDESSGALHGIADRAQATLFDIRASQHSSSAADSKSLLEGTAINLVAINAWVGVRTSKEAGQFCCEVKRDKLSAVSLQVSSKLFKRLGGNAFIGVDATAFLKSFIQLCRSKGDVKHRNEQLPQSLKRMFKYLESLYTFLIASDDTSNDSSGPAALRELLSEDTHTSRQTIMREQGLLDALLDILDISNTDVFANIKESDLRKTEVTKKSITQLKTAMSSGPPPVVAPTANRKRRASITDLLSSGANAVVKAVSGVGGGGTSHQSSVQPIARQTGTMRVARGASGVSSDSFGSYDSGLQKHRFSNEPPRKASFKDNHIGKDPSAKSIMSSMLEYDGSEEDSDDENAPHEQTSHIEVSSKVALQCLRVLHRSIKKNHTNQLYIADRFPVLLRQVKAHPVAVLCVEEMLKDNLTILQTKVRQREINMFVKLLQDTDMGVTYLRLLQQTCSSPMGVDATQRMVAYALFGAPKFNNAQSLPAHSTHAADSESGSLASATTAGKNAKFKMLSQKVARSSFVRKLARGTPSFVDMGSVVKATMDDELHTIATNSEQKLIMKLYADRTSMRATTWSDTGGLYSPSDPDDPTVMGFEALSKGLPQLYLSWTLGGQHGDYSMLQLFGYHDKVPLEVVCALSKRRPSREAANPPVPSPIGSPIIASSSNKPMSRRKATIYKKKYSQSNPNQTVVTIATYKNAVLEYFITQLYLTADLCLDRNYVSIGILEGMYEYDVLVSILKDENIPNKIKAPVTRIIRCLYVDREPQVSEKFPRYIRTSQSLTLGGGDETDPSKSSRFKFALVQQIIQEYVNTKLSTTKCDEFSLEIMMLLKALMGFGFYVTPEQIQDTLLTLVRVLDEHWKSDVPKKGSKARRTLNSGEAAEETGKSGKAHSSENEAAAGKLTTADSVRGPRRSILQKMKTSWFTSSTINGASSRVLPTAVAASDDDDDLEGTNSNLSASAKRVASRKKMTVNDSHMKQLSFDEGTTARREHKAGSQRWEQRYLDFTNSMLGMTLVLVVVFAVVIIAFVQIGSDSQKLDAQLSEFDTASTIFFCVELFMRLYCFVRVHHLFIPFFKDHFNMLDTLLVILDFALRGVGADSSYANAGRAGRTTRLFRLIRLVRVARMLRAAKLMKRMTVSVTDVDKWTPPARYMSITKLEANTLISILKILAMIYDRIQDKALGLTIKAFVQWTTDMKQAQAGNYHKVKSPVEIYQKIFTGQQSISQDISEKIDFALLDLLMYNDHDLAQEALNLLMIHKSQQDLYFSTTKDIQIIYSAKVEEVYRHLQHILRELQRLAEMFEIWSELESEDDKASAAEMLDKLKQTQNYVMKTNDDKSLGIRSLKLVDEEVQNLLRNLDAMSIFMNVLESLYDGGREALKPEVLQILRTCNELVCAFVKNSDANQVAAFKYIDWFVETVDEDIGSALVIRAILEGNKDLIKQCPRGYISDFAQKILSKGRKPDYLEMFVGMTELSGVMNSRVVAVENEISSHLTSREWKGHLVVWCSAPGSEQYKERKAAMERCHPSARHYSLPEELQYHILLLTLLTNCNLGPKLQAIYPIHDIIETILDPSTIFEVKKAHGLLLIENLKSGMERVEKMDYFWTFLDSIVNMFEKLPNDLMTKMTPENRIEQGEWCEICISIIISYFDYFDPSHSNEIRKVTSIDPVRLCQRTYTAFDNLVRMSSNKLGVHLVEEMNLALEITTQHIEGGGHDDAPIADHDTIKQMQANHHRSSVIFSDAQQLYFRKQFKVFMEAIKDVHSEGKSPAVLRFESIPLISDPGVALVRFEPLLKKLTEHCRLTIKRSTLSRSVDESATSTAVWLLKTLRELFESKLGYAIEDGEEASLSELAQENSKVSLFREIYNNFGVTVLCLDLISVGIDQALYIEAMKMLVVLLTKNGGCKYIQQTIFEYLTRTDSTLFFELVYDIIENLKAGSIKNLENISPMEEEGEQLLQPLPTEMISFRLLQLMCEGGFLDNKTQIREQTGNTKVFNIIDALAAFVGGLSKADGVSGMAIQSSALRTVMRLVQGPSRGNQEQFVLQTELLVSLNRIIRVSRPLNSINVSEQLTDSFEVLKENIIDVLRGIIEGQAESSLVYERVSTTIDLSALQFLVFPAGENLEEDILLDNDLTPVQAKFLVFLKTLGATGATRGTSVQDDLNSKIERTVTTVEVVMDHHVHTVSFSIPAFINDISKDSQNKVLASVEEHASQELKLLDFVVQCKVLYTESVHQQFLKRYGLAEIWDVKYYLTRVMFVNAVAMNCLILAYYGTREPPGTGHDDHYSDDLYAGDDVQYYDDGAHRLLSGGASDVGTSSTARLHMDDTPSDILFGLNLAQVVFACATLAIFLIIQVPVTFSSQMEKSKHFPSAVLATAMDPLPLWYACYLLFALLGVLEHRLFLSVLLLDWVVLDSTSRDLLKAVQYPARQLAATMVIILIMLNIFSCVVFVFYRTDVIGFDIFDMWETLKLSISYGFRGEYGIGHEMVNTLGTRLILDFIFYFVILAILRHIFFAIIVDTFGKLRELQFERDAEALNTCFICGVERHDFDKITNSGVGSGFNQHRNTTHDVMRYVFFIMSIWDKSQEEDSGVDIHVRDCLQKGDASWFPIGIITEARMVEGGHGGRGDADGAPAVTHVGGHSAGHHGGVGGGHSHHHQKHGSVPHKDAGDGGGDGRPGGGSGGGGGGGGGGGNSGAGAMSSSNGKGVGTPIGGRGKHKGGEKAGISNQLASIQEQMAKLSNAMGVAGPERGSSAGRARPGSATAGTLATPTGASLTYTGTNSTANPTLSTSTTAISSSSSNAGGVGGVPVSSNLGHSIAEMTGALHSVLARLNRIDGSPDAPPPPSSSNIHSTVGPPPQLAKNATSAVTPSENDEDEQRPPFFGLNLVLPKEKPKHETVDEDGFIQEDDSSSSDNNSLATSPSAKGEPEPGVINDPTSSGGSRIVYPSQMVLSTSAATPAINNSNNNNNNRDSQTTVGSSRSKQPPQSPLQNQRPHSAAGLRRSETSNADTAINNNSSIDAGDSVVSAQPPPRPKTATGMRDSSILDNLMITETQQQQQQEKKEKVADKQQQPHVAATAATATTSQQPQQEPTDSTSKSRFRAPSPASIQRYKNKSTGEGPQPGEHEHYSSPSKSDSPLKRLFTSTGNMDKLSLDLQNGPSRADGDRNDRDVHVHRPFSAFKRPLGEVPGPSVAHLEAQAKLGTKWMERARTPQKSHRHRSKDNSMDKEKERHEKTRGHVPVEEL